jgi:integral membrane protein
MGAAGVGNSESEISYRPDPTDRKREPPPSRREFITIARTRGTKLGEPLARDSSQTFRWVGYAEGTSFLVLLGIAMPLKYAAGLPEVVLVVGWVHGLLWVLYLLAAIRAAVVQKWRLRTLLGAGVASVLPFGPFVFERWLRRQPRKVDPHSTRQKTALR